MRQLGSRKYAEREAAARQLETLGQPALAALRRAISTADLEVRLDGKAVGSGKGAGKKVQPDQVGFEVVLPKGTYKLAIVAKGGAGQAIYARFLDPDRKLRYPEPSPPKR